MVQQNCISCCVDQEANMAETALVAKYRETIGSLSLAIVNLTVATTGDVYTIEKNAPVVDYWCQSHIGTAGYSPDVSYAPTTGEFTFTQASQVGNTSLFILLRS
jgi:hypothetical protein